MGASEKRPKGIVDLPNGAALKALDDGDDVPTNVGVRALARSAIAQQAQVDQLARDIAEIKTSVRTAIAIGRALLGAVPVVAAATSAIVWTIMHVAIK